jgi:bifunctional non-homologous end joining protein LigD
VTGSGEEFYEQACGLGIEGIVSKRRDAPYEPTRSRSWLKIKCLQRQEFVIGGFTEPEGSRVGLGALLLGVHDRDGRLEFAGKVGTGFTAKVLDDVYKKLSAREQRVSPFKQAKIAGIARAHWVKPELVAEVSSGNGRRTDGCGTRPSRDCGADKNPKDVVREKPRAVEDVADADAEPDAPKEPPAPKRPARSRSPEGEKLSQKRGSKTGGEEWVAGVRPHPSRPRALSAAGDHQARSRPLLRVHRQVDPSPREGRPLTLVRCPEGTEKGCFYMKHSGVWAPEALRRVKIQEKTKVGEYLVADDVAGLISLVQMGILEIHTWNALADSIERPDRVVFDLDPDPSVGWDRVAASALALRKRLRELGLESFVKTTGGKGLHVVVPLRPGLDLGGVVRVLARDLGRKREGRARGLHDVHVEGAAAGAHPSRLHAQQPRQYLGRRLFDARASGRARLGADHVGRARARGRSRPVPRGQHPERLAALKADPWKEYWTARQRLTATIRKSLGL